MLGQAALVKLGKDKLGVKLTKDEDIIVDFDRTDYHALSTRLLPCTNSNIFAHALDVRMHILWWSDDDNIWYLLDDQNMAMALSSVQDWIERARRFFNALPLYLRPGNPHEKDAAFKGLLRIAYGHEAKFGWNRQFFAGAWGNEVRCLYDEATSQEFRWLLDSAPAFDPNVSRALGEDGEEWLRSHGNPMRR